MKLLSFLMLLIFGVSANAATCTGADTTGSWRATFTSPTQVIYCSSLNVNAETITGGTCERIVATSGAISSLTVTGSGNLFDVTSSCVLTVSVAFTNGWSTGADAQMSDDALIAAGVSDVQSPALSVTIGSFTAVKR